MDPKKSIEEALASRLGPGYRVIDRRLYGPTVQSQDEARSLYNEALEWETIGVWVSPSWVEHLWETADMANTEQGDDECKRTPQTAVTKCFRCGQPKPTCHWFDCSAVPSGVKAPVSPCCAACWRLLLGIDSCPAERE